MIRSRTWRSALASIALALCLAAPAGAQQPVANQNEPILFKADQVQQDRDLGVTTARGHVEFVQGQRVLMADTVTYNQRTETITASGNVKLLEPSGEVIFAEYVELTSDMREGIIRQLRMRMTDDARIAAAGGRRTAGNRTEMRKAVYSPCKPCRDHPESAPLWQIKAEKVVHDQGARQMHYTDATLEFMGLPVAYTPYFTHPDPTVKRRTGFLTPSYGSDSELGTILSVPYYIDIAPDKDATFAPIITTNEGVVLNGEYRERFVHGEVSVAGSVTRGSVNGGTTETRGHIKSKGRFDLDDTWRSGFDLWRASDDTYLQRYGFESENTLTSRAFAEGFRGRNYASAQALVFQGLRANDDPGQTPIIAPLLDFNHVSEPGNFGGTWSFDANVLSLTRTEGTDSYRLSTKTRYEIPFTSRLGEVYRVFASLQADGYLVDEVQDPGNSQHELNGFTGRIFPQIGAEWRFPFVRDGETTRQVIEPVAGVIAAPNGSNPEKIPNEDSRDFELEDTNIFDPNRFTGLDRVEGGQRVYYGLKAGVYGPHGGFTKAFFGQSYRFRKDSNFSEGSGLDGYRSDFVGRVHLSPSSFADLLYRFRLDKSDLQPRRHELTFAGGPSAFRVGINYVLINRQGVASEFAEREEINLSASAKLTQHWTTNAHMRRDLGQNGGQISHGFGLIYDDECFRFTASYARHFTQDRDVRPTTVLLFRIFFKSLGELTAAG